MNDQINDQMNDQINGQINGQINSQMNRVAPDTDLAGYPANIFAGYPVSGRIYG